MRSSNDSAQVKARLLARPLVLIEQKIYSTYAFICHPEEAKSIGSDKMVQSLIGNGESGLDIWRMSIK